MKLEGSSNQKTIGNIRLPPLNLQCKKKMDDFNACDFNAKKSDETRKGKQTKKKQVELVAT